jgi:hypothetical protein
MAKRRGNPNWGKPEPIGPVVPTVTSFEVIVKEFKLSPDQYIRSTRLREWARRNKNSKYIPEALLEAWGFEIESTLEDSFLSARESAAFGRRFCVREAVVPGTDHG